MSLEETNSTGEKKLLTPVALSNNDETAVIEIGADGMLVPGHPLTDDFRKLKLPGYNLLSVLGTGGMGTVFLARQESLNRFVAVKMIKGEFAQQPKYVERLRSEARTMAAMNHPNVVGCYDIVTTDESIFLVMEYVPGHMTVRDLVLRFGHLREPLVIRILMDVVGGLSYVNQKGYTHRDMKPDNLMILRENQESAQFADDIFKETGARVLICDFGISHSVLDQETDDKNTIMGSPIYMAPEQFFTPESIDCRADMYALAATAYYMLTGQAPFAGRTREEVMEFKRTHGLPNPRKLDPTISTEFSRLLMRMGKPHPDDRYRNYNDLMVDLNRLSTMRNIWFSISRKEVQSHAFRNGILWSLGVLLLISLPFVLHRYISEKYFQPVKISLAKSMGYWDSESTEGWRRMPPDMEEPEVYMRGTLLKQPLVLRQELNYGDEIEFKARQYGNGVVMFGLKNDNGETLKIVWRRESGKPYELTMMVEHRLGMYIGDLPMKHMRWMTFRLVLAEREVVIYGDNHVIGVAHFKEDLGTSRFYINVLQNQVLDIKDVFVKEVQSDY